MPIPYHEYSSSSFSNHSASNSTAKWGPYTSSGDFGANMVVILVIIFCVLVLILALNALIRYILCAVQRHRNHPQDDPEKSSKKISPSAVSDMGPILIYSAGTKLAGAAAECSICLAEFAGGDQLRVLPACNHGFHVSCIENWLVTKKSCPTCRASCQVVCDLNV